MGAVGDRIYFSPGNAPCILVMDALTEELTVISTEEICRGSNKWWGLCQVSAEKVYFCPNEAEHILVLDIPTGALSKINISHYAGHFHWKWIGCCALDGE